MRCRVRFSCGHYKTVYIDQEVQDSRKRFDVLEHMRCEDCWLSACCKLVTMRYADYKNHYPACPTTDYDQETKTIGVYVPDDYLENGASSVDWRARKSGQLWPLSRERHSAKPWPPFLEALVHVERNTLAYIREMPYGTAFSCTCNAQASKDRDHK